MNRENAAAVELHIEELVLEGFERVDRARLEGVVRHELACLLVEQGVPARLRHGAVSLDGGAFTAQPGLDAATLGARIARAVYDGFGQ